MRTIADYYVDVGREEGRKEGREEGREEGILKTALNMIKEGANLKFVAKCTGLPESEISNLMNEVGV